MDMRVRKQRKIHSLNTKVFLLLTLVLCTIFMSAAFSESVSYTAAIDTLSISYSNCIPGNDYSLIVVNGNDSQGNFNASNLLFIDQITANSNGSVFIAFVNPSFPSCSVFLGGRFSNSISSPCKLGTYVPEEVTPESSFVLPTMLTTIEDEAFYGCSFTHVYLGEQVSSIGSKAFANSNSLQYIYIPVATNIIAGDAFSNSNNIIIGCHAGSYAEQYAQANGISYKTVD